MPFFSRKSSFSASTTTLSSVTSTSSDSSTATLTQKTRPQKDYTAAFATLQSTYGFGGGAPTPTFAKSSSKSTKSKSAKKADSQPAATTTTTPAMKGQERDWEAAFGALQSSYGFGGGAPVLPTVSKSMKSKSTKKQPAPLTTTQAWAQGKDWDAIYAAQHRFSGAPVAPGSTSWLNESKK